MSTETTTGDSSLRATEATLKIPANKELHTTLNHGILKVIQEFKKAHRNASKYILNNVKDSNEKSQTCEAYVIEKAKRKTFKTNEQKAERIIDAVATDTTGPITPTETEDNVILQIVIYKATGHTPGF